MLTSDRKSANYRDGFAQHILAGHFQHEAMSSSWIAESHGRWSSNLQRHWLWKQLNHSYGPSKGNLQNLNPAARAVSNPATSPSKTLHLHQGLDPKSHDIRSAPELVWRPDPEAVDRDDLDVALDPRLFCWASRLGRERQLLLSLEGELELTPRSRPRAKVRRREKRSEASHQNPCAGKLANAAQWHCSYW